MSRFERASVLLASLATLLTGLGYFWTKYLEESGEPWAVINHPWQPFFLKAHILVAPLLVFAVGMIAVRHVWRHFRAGIRWGRRSGLTTALSLPPLVASGYLIQVVTTEGWLRGLALSHIAVGFLFSAGVALHWVVVRRRAPRAGWFRQTRRLRDPGGARPAGSAGR